MGPRSNKGRYTKKNKHLGVVSEEKIRKLMIKNNLAQGQIEYTRHLCTILTHCSFQRIKTFLIKVQALYRKMKN